MIPRCATSAQARPLAHMPVETDCEPQQGCPSIPQALQVEGASPPAS